MAPFLSAANASDTAGTGPHRHSAAGTVYQVRRGNRYRRRLSRGGDWTQLEQRRLWRHDTERRCVVSFLGLLVALVCLLVIVAGVVVAVVLIVRAASGNKNKPNPAPGQYPYPQQPYAAGQDSGWAPQPPAGPYPPQPPAGPYPPQQY